MFQDERTVKVVNYIFQASFCTISNASFEGMREMNREKEGWKGKRKKKKGGKSWKERKTETNKLPKEKIGTKQLIVKVRTVKAMTFTVKLNIEIIANI